MIYTAYQLQSDFFQPFRAVGRAIHTWLAPFAGTPAFGSLGYTGAAWGLFSRLRLTHRRPDFGILRVSVGDAEVAITEEIIDQTPFGSLLHFRKDVDLQLPRVLIVAPLSGHFATLLRNTIRTMLPDHDVYVTDWHNARDIPTAAGSFGFDDYAEHVIRFIEKIGPGAHVVAVCQPCVPVLVAVAAMAAGRHRAAPRSMTLMAGPVDTRINPTQVNALASSKPIEWFEKNFIMTVPARQKGAGRRVYPGFVQLFAFMAMNHHRHQHAHFDLFRHLAKGEHDQAKVISAFYDEYFAVSDLPAEFYLETVQWVFQQARLAKGELTFRGQPVNLAAIKRTALLTVEGERDDICALGQTVAAHDLCTGLRPHMKRHHMQAGVGHYGVFSGRRWEKQIYPIVRSFIVSHTIHPETRAEPVSAPLLEPQSLS